MLKYNNGRLLIMYILFFATLASSGQVPLSKKFNSKGKANASMGSRDNNLKLEEDTKEYFSGTLMNRITGAGTGNNPGTKAPIDTSQLKIVILPFNKQGTYNGRGVDLGRLISFRLFKLNNIDSLNLLISYLHGYQIPSQFNRDSATGILMRCGADLIFYGDYISACTGDSVNFCLNWVSGARMNTGAFVSSSVSGNLSMLCNYLAGISVIANDIRQSYPASENSSVNYTSTSEKVIQLLTTALKYCNNSQDSIYCLEARSYAYYLTLNTRGIADLTSLLSVFPNNPYYLHERASLYLQGKQYEQAIYDMVQERYELEKGHYNLQLDDWRLMNAYARVNNEPSARVIAYKHIGNENYFPGWANYLAKAKKYDELLEYIKTYLHLNANTQGSRFNNEQRYFEMADIYLSREQGDSAMPFLSKLNFKAPYRLQLDAVNGVLTDSYFLTASSYECSGKMDSAIQYFQASIDSLGNSQSHTTEHNDLMMERYLKLSRCYAIAGDTANAYKYLNFWYSLQADTGRFTFYEFLSWKVQIDFYNHNYIEVVHELHTLRSIIQSLNYDYDLGITYSNMGSRDSARYYFKQYYLAYKKRISRIEQSQKEKDDEDDDEKRTEQTLERLKSLYKSKKLKSYDISALRAGSPVILISGEDYAYSINYSVKNCKPVINTLRLPDNVFTSEVKRSTKN